MGAITAPVVERYSQETRGKLSWFNPFDGCSARNMAESRRPTRSAESQHGRACALARPLPDAPDPGGNNDALTP